MILCGEGSDLISLYGIRKTINLTKFIVNIASMSRKNIGVSSGQSHIVKRSVKPSEKAVVQNDKKANTLSSESKQAEEQLLTQVK